MNSARPVLRARLSRPILHAPEPGSGEALLRRAIASRTCVIGTYNRGLVKLAPYCLYQRDDALFVDAVTVERNGDRPRETKLGSFRLAGLKEVLSTSHAFEPDPSFAVEDNRRATSILARL